MANNFVDFGFTVFLDTVLVGRAELEFFMARHVWGDSRETADLVVARVEDDAAVVDPTWNRWLRKLRGG